MKYQYKFQTPRLKELKKQVEQNSELGVDNQPQLLLSHSGIHNISHRATLENNEVAFSSSVMNKQCPEEKGGEITQQADKIVVIENERLGGLELSLRDASHVKISRGQEDDDECDPHDIDDHEDEEELFVAANIQTFHEQVFADFEELANEIEVLREKSQLPSFTSQNITAQEDTHAVINEQPKEVRIKAKSLKIK